ncbi:hypothetical protein LguiA_004097 [Lonicera macranthoides]
MSQRRIVFSIEQKELVELNPVPSASESESKLLYLKMKGAYYRYLAEFKGGEREKTGC